VTSQVNRIERDGDAAGAATVTDRARIQMNVMRAGVNYRF
jgi:hypothetical protein